MTVQRLQSYKERNELHLPYDKKNRVQAFLLLDLDLGPNGIGQDFSILLHMIGSQLIYYYQQIII